MQLVSMQNCKNVLVKMQKDIEILSQDFSLKDSMFGDIKFNKFLDILTYLVRTGKNNMGSSFIGMGSFRNFFDNISLHSLSSNLG